MTQVPVSVRVKIDTTRLSGVPVLSAYSMSSRAAGPISSSSMYLSRGKSIRLSFFLV